MSFPRVGSRGLALLGLVLVCAIAVWQFGVKRRAAPVSAPSSSAQSATNDEEAPEPPVAATGGNPLPGAMAVPRPTGDEHLGATPARDDARAQRLQAEQVRELVRLGRIGEARTEAGRYYQRWPDGPDVASLEQLTGLHPVPSGGR